MKVTWEPIESAPKEQLIVGKDADGGIHTYHWYDQKFHKKPRPYWALDFAGPSWSRARAPVQWLKGLK